MYKPNLSKEEIRLCFLRSLCVSLFLLFCFVAMHFIDNTIWVTSLAATAFIAFAFPKAQSVKTRVILGGYISAGLWGSVFSVILRATNGGYIVILMMCVAAVFLTSLCMTVFDFEHPPSAALAVGLVLSATPVIYALLALLAVVVLCLIKMPLAKLVLGEKFSAEDKQK